MPQIQSKKKRVKTNNKRNALATAQKTAIKTAIKDVLVAIEAKDVDKATTAYNFASSKLDKSIIKGLHHKNYARRQKARLSSAISKLK